MIIDPAISLQLTTSYLIDYIFFIQERWQLQVMNDILTSF